MPTPPVIAPPLVVETPTVPVVPGVGGVYWSGGYQEAEPTLANTALAATPVALPHQSTHGTVYGGQTGLPTSANSEAPIELSGSLTGLILSRGQSGHEPRPPRRDWVTRTLVIAISVLAFIGIIGLVVDLLAGDFLKALFGFIGNQ